MNKVKAMILGIALISGTAVMAQEKPGKGFEKWDTNGDGGLDKIEFAAMKQAHADRRAENGKPAPEKEVNPDKQFARIDTDGNGLISKEELAAKKEQAKERRENSPKKQ